MLTRLLFTVVGAVGFVDNRRQGIRQKFNKTLPADNEFASIFVSGDSKTVFYERGKSSTPKSTSCFKVLLSSAFMSSPSEW